LRTVSARRTLRKILTFAIVGVGAVVVAPVPAASPAKAQAQKAPPSSDVRVFKTQALGRVRVAISPDGKTLAASAGYGMVRLWDVASGEARPPLSEQGAGWVNALAFTRDGRTLITGGDDKWLRLWDLPSGKQTRRLEVPEGLVDAVSVSPDGKLVAAAGRSVPKGGLCIHTWDLATGAPRASFGAGRLWMIDLPFTPDSKLLASGGEGFTGFLYGCDERQGDAPTGAPSSARWPVRPGPAPPGPRAGLGVVARWQDAGHGR
jgi:WD40 repeat protein